MTIKNLILDWSGVISDDLFAVYKATMEILKKLGSKEIPFDKFKKDFCMPYMNYYRKATSETDKLIINQIFLEVYGKDTKAKAYKNAKETLEKLRESGINMVLLTSQLRPFVEKEITDFGLNGFFSQVHANVHDKGEQIENILRKTGFNKKNTAYVGDTVHDIKAARKAGLIMIAASYGYVERPVLEKESPDYIIDNITELIEVVSGK